MTIAQIKGAIWLDNAKLTVCKHRKLRGCWEYFVVYPSGKRVKVLGNRWKSVSIWLNTRIIKCKK